MRSTKCCTQLPSSRSCRRFGPCSWRTTPRLGNSLRTEPASTQTSVSNLQVHGSGSCGRKHLQNRMPNQRRSLRQRIQCPPLTLSRKQQPDTVAHHPARAAWPQPRRRIQQQPSNCPHTPAYLLRPMGSVLGPQVPWLQLLFRTQPQQQPPKCKHALGLLGWPGWSLLPRSNQPSHPQPLVEEVLLR